MHFCVKNPNHGQSLKIVVRLYGCTVAPFRNSGGQACMQTSQCLSYRTLQGRREGLPNLLKQEEKEGDDKEKKEAEEKGEEMQGKRRDEEMQDSLVVEEGMMVHFPLFPLLKYFYLKFHVKGRCQVSLGQQHFDIPVVSKDSFTSHQL